MRSYFRLGQLWLAICCAIPLSFNCNCIFADEQPDADVKQTSVEAGASRSQIEKPTHRQFQVWHPKKDGQPVQLQSFCVDADGKVLAICSNSTPTIGAAGESSKSLIVTFLADGTQSVLCEVPFAATAIGTAPDNSIFVGGDGKIAHLSPEGKELKVTSAPNLGDEEELRKKAEVAAKKMTEEYSKIYDQQIDTLKERIAELEKKDAEKLSKVEKARLTAYQQQIDSYREMVKQMQVTPETVMAQGRRITAIAANKNDVYVSCGSIAGSGYGIWRINHDLEEAAEVVASIAGCCGQMDVQCCEEGFILAENCSFKVGYYDRDGKSLNSFGKGDRRSADGFGSCCNPMNVLPMPGGRVLTAESSLGHIKCFDKDGKFVAYVGRAKIGGGCKHCSMGYDAKSDQYYMMAQDANGICVLGSNDRFPSMTEEEKLAAAIREKFLDRLLGQWQIGEARKAQVPSVLGSVVVRIFGTDETPSREETADDPAPAEVVGGGSLPFTQATFLADGSMKVAGGIYGQLNQDTQWGWEVKPESSDSVLKLGISMDQAEMMILSIRFTEDNQAEFTSEMYGQAQPSTNAKRVADCQGKPCGEKCADEPSVKPAE
jgi:hypothetical protein